MNLFKRKNYLNFILNLFKYKKLKLSKFFQFPECIVRGKKSNNLFKNFHFQRVIANKNEIFDIYNLGSFLAPDSLLKEFSKYNQNNEIYENIELVEIQENFNYKPHYHKKSAAIIYILSGAGQFILGSKVIDYCKCTRIKIPAAEIHGFNTKEKTVFLSIQTPSIVDEITGEIDIFYSKD